MKKQHHTKIIENKKIAENIYQMVLETKDIESVDPGQFIHIKLLQEQNILRRPISIAKYDDHTLTILYKTVGEGTKAMSTYPIGTTLDILGPLGHGFDIFWIKSKSKILLVGGGIGIAPLYQLALDLSKKDISITCVLGYSFSEEAYYINEFKKLGHTLVCSMDGKLGMKGHVGVALDTLDSFDGVYACGPLPLLMHVQDRFSYLDHTYLSLEERMACGMGACHGCDTKDKKHRVCYEGPVFKANEVEL